MSTTAVIAIIALPVILIALLSEIGRKGDAYKKNKRK
jgi:hypothetical protein